jgi:hypothetical protein
LIGVFTADFSVEDVTTYLSRLIQSRKLLVFVSSISGKPFAISSASTSQTGLLMTLASRQCLVVPQFGGWSAKGYNVRLQGELYLTAAPHWLPDTGFITGGWDRKTNSSGPRAQSCSYGHDWNPGYRGRCNGHHLAFGQLAKPLKILET